MIECDICEKEFPSKKSMTNHRRWHDLPEYKDFQESIKEKLSKSKSEDHKEKLSEAHKSEKAYNWKGNDVSYKGLHKWIAENKPKPKTCEICGKTGKLELSCVDHQYRRDINDFQWVHRECHRIYDIEKGLRIIKRNEKGEFKCI